LDQPSAGGVRGARLRLALLLLLLRFCRLAFWPWEALRLRVDWLRCVVLAAASVPSAARRGISRNCAGRDDQATKGSQNQNILHHGVNLPERIGNFCSTNRPGAAHANHRTSLPKVTLDDEIYLMMHRRRPHSPLALAFASSALPIPPFALDQCIGSSRNFRTSFSAASLK